MFNSNENGKIQFQYILPNIFTAASAFLGILSVILASRGEFGRAFLYIVFCLILDGLDGRVARITKGESKFGAEFDSLADIIAFGVAPAMLFYFSIGIHYGKLGALVPALFVVFGAIRLARFNVTSSSEPSVFIGVPIPTAAVISSCWTVMSYKYHFDALMFLVVLLHIFIAFLMVSNIRYPSFKKIDFKKMHALRVFIVLMIFISLIYLWPLEAITFFISLYVLYGLIRAAWNIYCKKIKKQI